MTHYQKLATIIFRTIGALLMFGALVSALGGIAVSVVSFPAAGLLFVLFYALPLTVVGISLFVFSRNLARWVCFDFDRFS